MKTHEEINAKEAAKDAAKDAEIAELKAEIAEQRKLLVILINGFVEKDIIAVRY